MMLRLFKASGIALLMGCSTATFSHCQPIGIAGAQVSPSQRVLNTIPADADGRIPDWVASVVSPQHARAAATLIAEMAGAAMVLPGAGKRHSLDGAVQAFRTALVASGRSLPPAAFSSRLAGGVRGASGQTSAAALTEQFNLSNRAFPIELSRGIQAASVLGAGAREFAAIAVPAMESQVRSFLVARASSLDAANSERYARLLLATSTAERNVVLNEDDGSLAAALLSGSPPGLNLRLARNLIAQHASRSVTAVPDQPSSTELWERLSAATAINELFIDYHRGLLGASADAGPGLGRPPFVNTNISEGLWDPYGILGAPSPRPPPWGVSTMGKGGLFPTQPLRRYIEGMYYPGILAGYPKPFSQRFGEEAARVGTLLTNGAGKLRDALPHLAKIGVPQESIYRLGQAQNVLLSGGEAFTAISVFASASSFGTLLPMIGAVGALGGALFGDGGLFSEGGASSGAGGGDALGGALGQIVVALAEIIDRLEELKEQISELRHDVRELSKDMQKLHLDMLQNFDQIFGQLAFMRQDTREIRDLVLAQTERDIGLCEMAIGLIDDADRRLSASLASAGTTSQHLRLVDPYRRLLAASSTSPIPHCLAGLLDAFGRDPVDLRNQIFLRRYSARVVASETDTSLVSSGAIHCTEQLKVGNDPGRAVAEHRGATTAVDRTAEAFSTRMIDTSQKVYPCARQLALSLSPLDSTAFNGTSSIAWRSWQQAARPRGDAFAHLMPHPGTPPSTLQDFDAKLFLHRAQRERWSSAIAAQGDLEKGLQHLLDGSKLVRHATVLRRLAGIIDLEEVLAGRRQLQDATPGIAREFLAHAESLLTIAVVQRSMLSGEGWLAPLSALMEGRDTELPPPFRADEAARVDLRRSAFALLASDAGADLARNLAMYTIVRRLSFSMEDNGKLDQERLRRYQIGVNVEAGLVDLEAALQRTGEPLLGLAWMQNHPSECLGFPALLGHAANYARDTWVLMWRLPPGLDDPTGLPNKVCVALPTAEQVGSALLSYPPQTEELARVRDEISADLLTQSVAVNFLTGDLQRRHVHGLISYIWMHTPGR